MKKLSFNESWEFTFEDRIDEFPLYGLDKYSDATGPAGRIYNCNNWEKLRLPHDWAVALKKDVGANTFAGAYPNSHFHRFMSEHRSEAPETFSVGWYRKQFEWDSAWENKRIWIEFEGVFRDATVWVNGVYLDRHASGYTSFALELTDHLVCGEQNSVAVRVDSDQPEGWWYEGSGIYRNVKLLIGEPIYFKYSKAFVRSELDGQVHASQTLVNDTAEPFDGILRWQIEDARGNAVAKAGTHILLAPYSEAVAEAEMKIDAPRLWDIDDPNLYTLRMTLGHETETVVFGIRSIVFDADRGMLLNGRPVKLRGACVHQDLGGVGTALTDNLQEYKIRRLKEMGVNAYRCSHHAPAPALLAACDRLGMLVMDETRMFGTSPEAQRQLTALIERDRNHPCVCVWSLGNEEFSVQNKAWSFHLMKKVTRLAKALDPTRPVTYGGNNGADFTGANAAAEIRGVNYIRNGADGDWLDKYHAEHPTQPILGTEEASFVLSRAGAVNDMAEGKLDSFGDVTMFWGSTPKGWVRFFEERAYLAGSFMWTGFDYRGEPNPFYYTNVVSSFGTIDLCGMEKPTFYYYKAWWTDEPVLFLAPHWNFERGEKARVAVFTNCEKITLYLNGKPIAETEVQRFDAPQFTVDFEPGVLSVVGFRNGVRLEDTLVTSGKAVQAQCTRVLAAANEADTAIYQLDAYDENGVFCPLASDELILSIHGGEIVGVGNGDPSSWADEQNPAVEKVEYIRAFDSEGGRYEIPPKAPNALPKRIDRFAYEPQTGSYRDDFRMVAEYQTSSSDRQTVTLTATVECASDYEYIEFERMGCPCEVYRDGERLGDTFAIHGFKSRNTVRPYRFYAPFSKGTHEITVTAQKGSFDPPILSGSVKLGKAVQKPWKVRFHYGKARVFVRSDNPESVILEAELQS